MKRREQADTHFRFYLLCDLSVVSLPRHTSALDFQGFSNDLSSWSELRINLSSDGSLGLLFGFVPFLELVTGGTSDT